MHDDLTPEHYWAAGFLEGEGCFYHNGGYLRITTAQKEREPLERLQRLIGGRIHEDRSRANPLFVHCLSAQAEVEAVIDTLYPLLSSRRQRQIDKARAARDGYKTSDQYLIDKARRAEYMRKERAAPGYAARHAASQRRWAKKNPGYRAAWREQRREQGLDAS